MNEYQIIEVTDPDEKSRITRDIGSLLLERMEEFLREKGCVFLMVKHLDFTARHP